LNTAYFSIGELHVKFSAEILYIVFHTLLPSTTIPSKRIGCYLANHCWQINTEQQRIRLTSKLDHEKTEISGLGPPQCCYFHILEDISYVLLLSNMASLSH
jgi:hypothetical protein